jgi:tripartite-type tricarboxylate transporter receptor subunit TctC
MGAHGRRRGGRATAWLAGGAMAISGGPAFAQGTDFPPKTIAIVVGFPAGGGSDLFARLFAQKLGPVLGTTVVVENRPGAAGTTATGQVVRAAPTGATLLFTPSNLAMAQALYRQLPFDARTDLAPVLMTARIAFALVVHPSLPTRNLREFIALAKQRPGAMDYGSSGAGSPPFFAMELLKHRAAIDVNHIPYKGAGPILTAILGGEVQSTFLIPPLAKQHIQSGKLRGLAVSTPTRSPALPELPTVAEAGVPGFDVTQWHGLFAPAKTPAAIVGRLRDELAKILTLPDVRQRLLAEGADIAGGTPADLGNHLAAEIRVWSDLVQRIGLKPE